MINIKRLRHYPFGWQRKELITRPKMPLVPLNPVGFLAARISPPVRTTLTSNPTVHHDHQTELGLPWHECRDGHWMIWIQGATELILGNHNVIESGSKDSVISTRID